MTTKLETFLELLDTTNTTDDLSRLAGILRDTYNVKHMSYLAANLNGMLIDPVVRAHCSNSTRWTGNASIGPPNALGHFTTKRLILVLDDKATLCRSVALTGKQRFLLSIMTTRIQHGTATLTKMRMTSC